MAAGAKASRGRTLHEERAFSVGEDFMNDSPHQRTVKVGTFFSAFFNEQRLGVSSYRQQDWMFILDRENELY